MRKNLPIIDETINIPVDFRLISRTDTKGTILEANHEFIEISGFSKEELIGQPHNITRHPDVPEAVFKDMWNTLQSGQSWTQIVKNRTKDGRNYWIKANAAPLINDGKITGYLSIRKPATQAEIQAAKEAYPLIDSGKLKIESGQIYPPSQYALEYKNPFVKMRLFNKLLFTGLALILLGTFMASIFSLESFNHASSANQKAVYNAHQLEIDHKIDQLQSESTNLAIGLAIEPEIRKSLETSFTNKMAKEAFNTQLPQIENFVGHKIKVHLHKPNSTSFLRSWTDKSKDDLSSFRFSVNKISKTHQIVKTLELGRAGIAIRSLVPVYSENNANVYVGSLEIVSSLTKLSDYLATKEIHYDTLIMPNALEIATKAKSNPNIGDLTFANKDVDPALMTRLRNADMQTLLKKGYLLTDTKFYSAHPIYDAREKLIGYHLLTEGLQEINAFNKKAKDFAMATIIQVFVAILLTLILFIIMVSRGVLKPIKNIIKTMNDSSDTGDLSLRLDDRFDNEIGELGKAYNRQMQTTQIALGEASRMVSDLAFGDFETQTVAPMKGDFLVMKNSLNSTVSNIKSTFGEITAILTQIRHGNFNYIPKGKFTGEYKVAMQQAQAAMAILQGVFFEVNELMEQVSRGYFTRRITAEAQGELMALKDNINESLNKLEAAIGETTNVMIAQGAGDLKQRIESNFEGTLSILKDGINNSVTNIGSLMSQSNYSINKLSDGAIAISRDIADLSTRTQEQAAAVEQTAASMEEITSTIEQTANNAKNANDMANTSLQEAQQANQVVHETISSINEISEASHKISEITALIDSIAFQTNLLALNAAVEAARAGEHGRGFAVVAGEVRNLAGKSAEAAKDIRALIDDTVKKVEQGAKLAHDSGEALNVINTSIGQIGSLVSEITQTTAEQAKGVSQVNLAITSIDHATQENAALVDETAGRTDEMGRQATDVSKVISTFKIDLEQIGFANAMKTGQFAFAQARRAHRQWKGMIRAYLDGMEVEINEAAATDHHKCGLGLWFYGEEGQKYAHLPEMQTVDKYHAELHSVIKLIMIAYKEGDLEKAEAEFRKLGDISELVISNLTKAEIAVTRQLQSSASPVSPPVAALHAPTKKASAKTSSTAQARPALAQSKPKPSSTNQTAGGLQTPAPVQPKQNNSDEWGEF